MALTIDPERLRQIRKARGLTQDALGKKAGLDKGTVYRFEKSEKPIRNGNLTRLAEALHVDPKVLIGEKPLPGGISEPRNLVEESFYQLNVRLHPAVRNAFELVARRFGVSASKIAALAPLMFVIIAEGSLKYRARKIDECRTRRDEFSKLACDIPYLDIALYQDNVSEFEAEERSIVNNDVFGKTLCNALPDNWDKNNPFATYLQAMTRGNDEIVISAVGPTSVDYRLCRSAALALVGGEEDVADSLLNGEILIHQMPRGLNAEQRISWMREHRIVVDENKQEDREDTPEELPKYYGRALAIEF